MANAFKYGNSVDTDVILPARYLALFRPDDLAAHCMEDIDPPFSDTVRPGDIIVAGENFGCGSSREHAPLAIKACGVSCVVAVSFARIFYRNAINIGLPIIESPQAASEIMHGDTLYLDWDNGQLINTTRSRIYHIPVFPGFIQNIINKGGLMASICSSRQPDSLNVSKED